MGETPIYGMNNPATENPDQESAPVPPSWYQPAPIYYAQPVSPQPHQKDEKGFFASSSLDLMDWKMSFGTKEILGYPCFKAECDFRGRHWTALDGMVHDADSREGWPMEIWWLAWADS